MNSSGLGNKEIARCLRNKGRSDTPVGGGHSVLPNRGQIRYLVPPCRSAEAPETPSYVDRRGIDASGCRVVSFRQTIWAGTSSHPTLRWRESDSNHRSLSYDHDPNWLEDGTKALRARSVETHAHR